MQERNGSSRAAPSAGQQPIRASKRVRLPIPVRFKVGTAAARASRLRDASLLGLFVAGSFEGVEVGEPAVLHFEGYPGVCGPFGVFAHVSRHDEAGVAVEIDREATGGEVLQHYRKLVVHYLRHRPLLDELRRRFFEGRCEACGWLGRVAGKEPVCARCGERVVAASEAARNAGGPAP